MLCWIGRWRGMACLAAVVSAPAQAAAPAYDHIVVVVEENHSFSEVIGSSDAPFLNSLATGGALLTGMHGITHPSQPNYLHLFSGASQGQTTNGIPVGIPFTTSNLGGALAAAGRSFTGYSESLPSVGFQGDSFTADLGVNQYARKHNPWMNWLATSPTGFQLPMSAGQPFTSFPGDFTMLPTVSFVTPNEQHNMHDGSIAEADAWLQANLAGYATWAAAHNSLLVVTWDEDLGGERNRVPTVLFGAGVRQGEVPGTWTLHNLLRTIEDSTGAGHSGSAADVQPIVGAFAGDPVTVAASFRQGEAGYGAVTDTWIEAATPAAAHGGDPLVVVDAAPLTQALVRFDDLFGPGGRIPDGATIVSAKLSMLTEMSTAADSVAVHRMLIGWSGSSTWSSLGAGVSTDDVEAVAAAEFHVVPNAADSTAIFDVTASLRAWQADPATNHGWLLENSGVEDWVWFSSEVWTSDMRPELSVVYAVPEPTTATLAASFGIALIVRRRRRVTNRSA
ncbi:MAG: alkaline phosphatase family protein [Planctomycetaceae bacterium]